ncbi:MAG: DUF1588 domain-containing protein [Sandaracinaceae bacterium]
MPGRLTKAALVSCLAACTGTVTPPGTSAPPPGQQTTEFASASGARRLSQVELDSTLADLLQDDSRRALALNSDEYTPFDNDITTQQASMTLITNLEIMAHQIATQVVDDPTRRDAVVPCTPTGPGDADCLRQFIETWAPRALRRPVTDDEVDAYMTLQSFATEDNPDVDNDFYTAVRLIIAAVLQDPEFLYRIERGTERDDRPGVFALDGFELATRLSYLITGSTPDAVLLADAASGALDTADGRRAAAERLLDTPDARTQIHRFHAMWLGHRILAQPPELVAAFNRETGALIDRVVFEEDRPYTDVFTADETYLDDFLADHYALPHPTGGEGWVPYGDSGRGGGILSHGSLLAAFAKFADTSPTQRGILIRTRLMCQTIPPPPASVNVDDPPVNTDNLCKVEQYAAHRNQSGCSGCHSQMDPLGFGLENFDMAGRYRDHDEGRPECPIDGVGEVPGLGTFRGPGELGQRLVDEQIIDACALEQYYQFATGRPVLPIDAQVIDGLVDDFRAAQLSLRGIILSYVASERFAHRREEAL